MVFVIAKEIIIINVYHFLYISPLGTNAEIVQKAIKSIKINIKSIGIVQSVQKMGSPTASGFGEVGVIKMQDHSRQDTNSEGWFLYWGLHVNVSLKTGSHTYACKFSVSDLWLCTSETSIGDSEKISLKLKLGKKIYASKVIWLPKKT